MRIVGCEDPNFLSKWQKLFDESQHQHPFGTSWDIEYQREYLRDLKFKDLSFLVESEEGPVLGLRLFLEEKEGSSLAFSNAGRPLCYLENSRLIHQRPSAFRLLKEQFLKISRGILFLLFFAIILSWDGSHVLASCF